MEVNEVRRVTEIAVTTIGIVQVQLLRVFVDSDGAEVARNGFVRYILEPGADLTGQPQDVIDIANLWWTQARIDAWTQHKIDNGMMPALEES